MLFFPERLTFENMLIFQKKFDFAKKSYLTGKEV